MSIKRKISVLFLGALLVYILAFIIFEAIQRHEQDLLFTSRINILKESVRSAISIKESTIQNVVSDYTNWDEMADYILSQDSVWARNNLATVLETQNVNAVWIYNLKKELIFFTNNTSPDPTSVIPIPRGVFDSLYQKRLLTFYLDCPEGLFLISGGTIHSSMDLKRIKNPKGYLFFASKLDKLYFSELGSLTSSNVKNISREAGDSIDIESSQVKYLFPLKNWDGKEITNLMFIRDFPYVDDFFMFSRLLMILFIGIGLIIIVMLYVLFTSWVSRPLTTINHSLKTGDISNIEVLKGSPNEFGQLSQLLESFILQKRELENEINQKIKTEKLLSESEEKFSKAFLFSPAAMMISSLGNGKIITVNESFSKITGLRLIDLIDKTVQSINVFHDPEVFISSQRSSEFIANKKQQEIFLKSRSGDLKIGILKCDMVHLQGQPCLLSVIIDITERKQVEMAINMAKEKAEESDRLKYYLLLNMSHELRTPLTGIIGFAEVIRDDSTDNFAKGLADRILISSDRLLSTLNGIMLLAEIHSGNLKINYQDCNLDKVLLPLVRYYQVKAGKKSITLNYISDGIIIHTDPEIITQIMERILDNAVKFSESGTINITVSQSRDDNKPYVTIAVSDKGLGIPHDKLEEIFLEFRQISEGVGRSFEGSGLGLSIARHLTKLLKGEILVQSALHEGSCFTVKLPV